MRSLVSTVSVIAVCCAGATDPTPPSDAPIDSRDLAILRAIVENLIARHVRELKEPSALTDGSIVILDRTLPLCALTSDAPARCIWARDVQGLDSRFLAGFIDRNAVSRTIGDLTAPGAVLASSDAVHEMVGKS